MQKYLLSIYQPDGDPPPPDFLEPIMRDVSILVKEMQAAPRTGLQRRTAPSEHSDGGARSGR